MEVSLYKIKFISTNTLLKLGAQRPPGREGGIFINIPEKDQYLLFSGVSLKRYSDVFIFDMNTKKWTKENCTGAQPKDLCYAYGWYDKPNFFFYGGKNKELSLSDVAFAAFLPLGCKSQRSFRICLWGNTCRKNK